MEPPPIHLIKGKYDGKSDKDFVKLKLSRYSTSSISDLYKFKMSLFDIVERKGFLLFVHNFNINLGASGKLETGA